MSGQVVGEDRCPIVDTYWQTETGAHVLAPIPGVWPAKPGSATLPFFGVQPAMVNEQVCTAQKHNTVQLQSKPEKRETEAKLTQKQGEVKDAKQNTAKQS